MANLEFIKFNPVREIIREGELEWLPDQLAKPIDNLPQIFWENGTPWNEANHWALTKISSTLGGHIKTVTSLMKHLAAYASWLEHNRLDWRNFPLRKQDRTIVLYRGQLIKQRDDGSLAPATTRARMAAVIQFYRHAQTYGFVQRRSPMWEDRNAVIRFFDTVGFERTITRLSSELAIPNRKRSGLRLEGGLSPLNKVHATQLLEFTKEQGLEEINLMLSLGIFSGARFGTITSLSVKDVENAYVDVQAPDTYLVPIGPGTGVKTKLDVNGNLMVPRFLIECLKAYAYSIRRLKRQGLSTETNRGLLFLTSRGSPYSSESFNRLMTDLRQRSKNAGMHFMTTFKFHQTRATYGTWLMEVAMGVTDAKNAVAFVRDAMLHKDESTTFLYLRFHNEAPVKAQMSNQFSKVFSGVVNRNWNLHHA